MTLRELKCGECAVVTAVGGEGALRQHFLDMGLLPGVEVRLPGLRLNGLGPTELRKAHRMRAKSQELRVKS